MENLPVLDAIILADSGVDSLSGTNPLKLHLDGRVGDIQVVANYVQNNGRIIGPVEGDNLHSWASAPKLNGIYLTSYLTQNNFNVELIHNYASEKQRFASLLALDPKAVILSTSFIFFKQSLRDLVTDIRSIAPEVCIMAGGPFIYYSYLLLRRVEDKDYETTLPADDFLFLRSDSEPDIDLYIISPGGEDILCNALEKKRSGHSLINLPNTARLESGSYIFGPMNDQIPDVSSNMINWDLLPDSIFRSGVIPIQASNGCPYDCAFCNFTKDRRITYVKPLDDLIDELKIVQQKGADYVWFVDDNFRLGRHDLDDVCRRMTDADIRVKWMCFIRASTLQKTDLELLRQAGCIEVQIGLESGDPQILDYMNKRSDPGMYREVISKVLEQGINVSCYFITGFPGETENTAATTRNFIQSIENPEAEGSLSWSIYPFLLTPLSPVYEPEMRKKFRLTGYLKDWEHETMDYKGAKQLALQAFFELENSGQIYRGDNLDILDELPYQKRKKFYRIRQMLAKKSLKGQLEPDEILRSFKDIF